MNREMYCTPSATLLRRMGALVVLGAVTFLAGLLIKAERAWMDLLLVSVLLLSIGLAAAVFIAFQYVTGASWSVALRRVPEAVAGLLPVGGLGVLAVVFLRPSLYAWTNPAVAAEMPTFRHWWLQLTFFRLRAVFFLLLWTALTAWIVRASRQQDSDGAARHTRGNVARSALLLAAFGLTYWLATYDWIMSLQPQWSSTIFGMYNFAGLFVSGLAVMAILLAWLRRRAPLNAAISTQHLHDLGKLMFAFSTFWMYLWFSQYMLIWYANIPEEATYYAQRQQGFWGPLLLLNVALNWVLPFLALLPRRNKQSASVLVKVAIALLAGRCVDLYLMIGPVFDTARPQLHVIDLGMLAGACGVFAVIFFSLFRSAAAVPVNDPYLLESLHYHA